MVKPCLRTIMAVSAAIGLVAILGLNAYVGKYDKEALGDLATWVGSYVSFLTLITSIMIAWFAYKITNKQTVIAERAYMVELLRGLAEKVDNSLIRHDIQEKQYRENESQYIQENYDDGSPDITPNYEGEDFVADVKPLSIFVTTICKAQNAIDISTKSDKEFYIDIFKTYLDTDVNIELSKELRLDWLRYQNVSDKIIKDVKIQYEWARKFLDLEYTPRRPNI